MVVANPRPVASSLVAPSPAVPRTAARPAARWIGLAGACFVLWALPADGLAQWTHFRGDGSASVSGEVGLPESFDVETGANVAWRADLPGRGPASPIVVGRRVIVTASSGARQDRLHVLCFDSADGRRLWHRQLWATGHTVCHPFGAVAAPTPASDGRLVFAFYSSNDLACFDLDGNLRWLRGLALEHPAARNDVGMASSPLVVGSTVIVQCENAGDSFAEGIDTATGRTRWHLDRPAGAVWSSPTLLPGGPGEEDLVLLVSRSELSAHRPDTGAKVWSYEASCHTIASPTVADSVVYLQANGLSALRGRPGRSVAELLWHEPKLRSDNPSPVVHDGRVYVVKPPGILVCGDAHSGEVLWQLRLEGPFWATPVLADGRLYCVSHPGLVQIVRIGDRPERIAACRIDEGILASPAVAEGAVYFRSDARLWKIQSSTRRAAGPGANATGTSP